MIQVQAYNSKLVGYCRYVEHEDQTLYNAYDVITGLHIDPVLAYNCLIKFPEAIYIMDSAKGTLERSDNFKIVILDYAFIDANTYLNLVGVSPLYRDSNYFDQYEIQDPITLIDNEAAYNANLSHFRSVLAFDRNMGLNTLK